jgi:hypothetical protein
MAINKITGRVEVLVNGDLLLSKTGATALNVGLSGETPFERSAVIGENQIAGFIETPVVPQIDVTITDIDTKILDDVKRINGDGTIIFRAAGGGKVYTLNNAASTGVSSHTSGEGDTTLSFIGITWSEAVQ